MTEKFQSVNHRHSRNGPADAKPSGSKFFVSKILISNFFVCGFCREFPANPMIPKITGGRGIPTHPSPRTQYARKKEDVRKKYGPRKCSTMSAHQSERHAVRVSPPAPPPTLFLPRSASAASRRKSPPMRPPSASSHLPLLEDANAVQIALMKVIQMLSLRHRRPQNRRPDPLRPANRQLPTCETPTSKSTT